MKWFSLLAVLTAILYFIRTPRRIAWAQSARYLIGLFCVWSAAIFIPGFVGIEVLEWTGFLIVLVAFSLYLADFFLSVAERIYFLVAMHPAFNGPLPQYYGEICRAAQLLATKRIGALIIIERSSHLNAFLQASFPFDADVKAEILIALFATTSPVHDGAIIITRGRIRRVRSVLPLSTNESVPFGIGTRHRAAIGITERTDAVAVVVSEERGEVSVCCNGQIGKTRSEKELIALIKLALRSKSLVAKPKK